MRKSLVIILFMSLLIPSCAANTSPRKVVSLSYHQTSANEWPDIWFDLRMDKDSVYTLTNSSRRSKREALRAVVPAEVADNLAQIAEEEQMDKYEYYYEPPFPVYDGWQWSLYISFDDKSSVSSSGHMESPRGDGLKRLEEYLKEVWAKVDESQAEIVDIW
jgi:hypothetical protein